jgi:hypothetical protein
VKAPEVPGACLGAEPEAPIEGPGSRLGWNAWLLSLPRSHAADDAVFPVEAVDRLG